jgi:hypothetical protein
MNCVTTGHISVSWNIFQDGLARCLAVEPVTFPKILNNHHFVWISLYSSKTVDKKIYYVLFLIQIFIVQVIEVVQFTYYNTFSKIPPSISMHSATRVRTWRVARLYSVQTNSSISETVRNWTHVHIQFLLRMADTMTSQNIAISFWDTLYNPAMSDFLWWRSWAVQISSHLHACN